MHGGDRFGLPAALEPEARQCQNVLPHGRSLGLEQSEQDRRYVGAETSYRMRAAPPAAVRQD